MADNTAEQLSALLDGECEASEAELLLRRLSKDADLKARWQRYHLISDAIKNNIPEVIDPDFTDRVSRAIEADAPLQTHSPPFRSTWFKPAAGFALAVSVAAVALMGLRFSQYNEAQGPRSFAAVTPPELRLPEQPGVNNAAVQSRFNSYLVNHNEYASMNSVHGMLPYVRMVGYEPKRY